MVKRRPSVMPVESRIATIQLALDARDDDKSCHTHGIRASIDDGPPLSTHAIPSRRGPTPTQLHSADVDDKGPVIWQEVVRQSA